MLSSHANRAARSHHVQHEPCDFAGAGTGQALIRATYITGRQDKLNTRGRSSSSECPDRCNWSLPKGPRSRTPSWFEDHHPARCRLSPNKTGHNVRARIDVPNKINRGSAERIREQRELARKCLARHRGLAVAIYRPCAERNRKTEWAWPRWTRNLLAKIASGACLSAKKRRGAQEE
jgi:hypothetical protein